MHPFCHNPRMKVELRALRARELWPLEIQEQMLHAACFTNTSWSWTAHVSLDGETAEPHRALTVRRCVRSRSWGKGPCPISDAPSESGNRCQAHGWQVAQLQGPPGAHLKCRNENVRIGGIAWAGCTDGTSPLMVTLKEVGKFARNVVKWGNR